jgi:SsrA-binding protein
VSGWGRQLSRSKSRICYNSPMAALVRNKKAGFNFEFIEKLEAGIELRGFEVKSIRAGHGSLEGAYVVVRGSEAYLVNAYFPPYQQGNTPKDYDPYRPRRLLLNKKELHRLIGIEKHKGLTIVPISMYNKGRFLKAEVAIARGKKQHDKRETLKKRDADRDVQRTLKGS